MIELPVGVSFLICTYNGAARIAQTLMCLAQQINLPAAGWEVILVDNASTDDTSKIAQQVWNELGHPAPLHALLEMRPGKQYALETAIGKARYRYTCIVDDDNRLAPDYMLVGLEILESNQRIGILGGPNTPTFEGSEPEWFHTFQHCYAVGRQIDYASGQFKLLADGNIGRNVLWGAGMFVRTAVWRKLREVEFQSLFSGRQGEGNLTAGEDDELCYAALLLGYEVWYSSRLHLQHHMTAGRLTETYRNRLFYASALSTARLNAYRNALWGKQDADVSVNLLKDIGYVVRGIMHNIFSWSFVRAVLAGSSIAVMNQRNAITVVMKSLLHIKEVKSHYETVLQLKRKIDSSTAIHEAV